MRDKWTGKTKGYGFVSFANASDLAAAMKEMNGAYFLVWKKKLLLIQPMYLFAHSIFLF